ncbi:MAG: class I SAM-dependent methyltransferase, partial [Desulfamplus sp.]|nr:class I SAM-dependent methyltransferase [Desulfamplus sp.]
DIQKNLCVSQKSEDIQKDFFEIIGDQYLLHYNDHYSRIYRERFIYKPMVQNINLEGKIVLDAMCGSGQISEFVSMERCELHGLDISDKQMELYRRRFPDADCYVRSILDTGFSDSCFDVVLMCGGLHHVHPHVNQTVTEIHRILKPGGFFIFAEPHANTVVDNARRFWYAADHFFMSNESAVDYVVLEKNFVGLFDTVNVKYFGNIAYYLIYNSLILRIPLRVKKIIAPFALFLESKLLPLHTHFMSSYLVAQWQKK